MIDKPRYNMFHRTQLEEELRSRGVNTIVLAGATTNCCVESTARDGFMRDNPMGLAPLPTVTTPA